MAIIRPSLVKQPEFVGTKVLRPSQAFGHAQDSDDIPFVPAFDLLEQLEARLSDEEASAVACALINFLPEPDQSSSAWSIQGRLEAVSQREI